MTTILNMFLVAGFVAVAIRGVDSFKASDYHLIDQPMSWTQAADTCKRMNFGYLLTLESLEEFMFLIPLMPAALGRTYWTQGSYKPDKFYWPATNAPIPDMPGFPFWLPGHPSKSAQNKIVIQYPTFWSTSSQGDSHRFFCKKPSPSTPVPCFINNDLLVMMDSSGSIGSANYVIMKDFAAGIALAYRQNKDSRVGFGIYSKGVEIIVHPVNSLTPSAMATAVRSARYIGDTTATDVAINAGVGIFDSIGRNVPKNLLVITDGYSNSPLLTKAAATAALAKGIRTYAVGVAGFNQQELLDIAGGVANHVKTKASFNELMNLLRPVTQEICAY